MWTGRDGDCGVSIIHGGEGRSVTEGGLRNSESDGAQNVCDGAQNVCEGAQNEKLDEPDERSR